MQTLMVSLRGRGYTRLCLSAALSDWLGSRGVCVSRMWALEESASAQSAARSHTDAVLQHGIKTPGPAPFPRIFHMKERRYKMFLKFSIRTSAVCRESDRAFSHTRVCVLLPCCVASGICKVSLTSPATASSCPPRYPLSATQSQHTKDSVWIRQNIIHSRATVIALSCSAYLIYLSF